MAVLNSLLRGQLKGRIGNNWFAHARDAKGRPVTRTGTINTTPNNPRSASQQQRRAKFANAVKFYQRAQNNFFRFAFEDKKKNESDYNAFMRHNIDNSLLLDKSLVQNSNFPALGDQWQLSQGNLTNFLLIGDDVGWTMGDGFSVACYGETIGDVSKNLKNDYGIEDGTIITFVFIGTQLSYDNVLDNTPTILQPVWNIFQMIVDVSDDTLIDFMPHTNDNMMNRIYNADNRIIFNVKEPFVSFWAGVVITKKKNSGLYCSTSYLMPNNSAKALVEYYNELERVSAALDSWSKTDETILQGSVSGSSSRVTTIDGESKPLDLMTVDANGHGNFTILGKNMDQLRTSDFSVVNGSITGIGALTKQDGCYLGLNYGSVNGPGSLSCEGETIITWEVIDGVNSSSGTSGSSSSTDTDKSSQDANA